MSPMDPELKAKWLAALRSGEYKQGNGFLCTYSAPAVPQHCCLGVLAEVAGVPRADLFATPDRPTQHDGVPYEHLSQIHRGDLLGPWSPANWVSLRPYDPSDPTTHHTTQQILAAMNDAGKSFGEIADWIEANL